MTTRTTFISVGIAAIFVAGLALVSRPAPSGAGTAPTTVTASERSFDLGTLSMATGTVTHDVTLTNTGDEPVTLGRVYTSCMCTTAKLTVADRTFGAFGMAGMGYTGRVGKQLAPGESATLAVTFDPAAHGPAGIGYISRQVTVELDGQQPLVTSFAATVTP